MPYSSKKLEEIGLKALRAGESVLLRDFQKLRSPYTLKSPGQILTAADMASNAAILRVFKKETPDFNLLSEEGAPTNHSDWRWIIDPLDGTTNFAARIPVWGISIALEYRGETILGLISLPLQKTIYIARKGGGAWKRANGKALARLRVSRMKKLRETFGLMCYAPVPQHISFENKLHAPLVRASHVMRNLGAAVFEAASVAEGHVGYAVILGMRPWDAAAGALLVREAGGNVRRPDGKEWSLHDPQIVFSAPGITRPLHRIINAA